MKVVINVCFGGFGISEAAVRLYADRKGLTLYPEHDERFSSLCGPTWWLVPPSERIERREWSSMSLTERVAWNRAYHEQTLSPNDIARDDADLVAVVEALGEQASTRLSELRVVEIPDGIEWVIEEYDGNEHVAQKHTTWR